MSIIEEVTIKKSSLFQFSDNQNGWLLDDYHLSSTTNGGGSWKNLFQSKSDYLEDMQLLSGQTLYLATQKRLYKTMDGGVSWLREYTLPEAANNNASGFISLYFTDDHHGWACCSNGKILRYSH